MTNEYRYKAIMSWLRALHGEDVKRSFLHESEAKALTANEACGRLVAADLDTDGYAGKWRLAVEESIANLIDPEKMEFWIRAREYFLSCGGSYRQGWHPTHVER